MQVENISPDVITFVCVLKACGSIAAIGKGRATHIEITQNGLESAPFVGNTLIDMYAKCGLLSEAREAFDKLPVRDVMAWTALIAGYAEHGPRQEALQCFEQMQLEHCFYPPGYILIVLVKACARFKDLERGRVVHAEIAVKGSERDVVIGNTLVNMYAKCGSLVEAHEVFDKLTVQDVVSWNILIAGYAEHGPSQQALKCFEQMQSKGISSDAITFFCILKACGSIGAINMGQVIHIEIARKGFEVENFLGSSLVDMYAKCGLLSEAREVFDKLPVRDVVLWAALIGGYAEHGPGQEALKCFEQMQYEGISPDAVMFACALKACSSIGGIEKGREIHGEIAQKGLERDLLVGNTLVDMYAKGGLLSDAWEIFDKLPVRDTVSWVALISGYAEHGPCQEALKCVEQMQLEGALSLDAVTFVCALKACGSVGAIGKVRELHAKIVQRGLESDILVGNMLLDVYAKCGSLSEAQETFEKLPFRNVVSWSAMIQGYGLNHEGNRVVQCFEDMQEQGMEPDAVTFTCLLAACSQTNLVFSGQEYFKVMREEYGIVPTRDHYTCVVDLLARSGHLDEAEKFLQTMRSPPSDGTWRALLSACKTYGGIELGLRCFQPLVQLNPESASSYVLLANAYASTSKWDYAHRLEELRRQARAKKKPATALIEVNREVHEFVVGSSQSKETLAMLNMLSLRLKAEGHVPNVDTVLRSGSEKEAALCEHAEESLSFPGFSTCRLRMRNDYYNASKVMLR